MTKFDQRKQALKTLNKIDKDRKYYLIIHYTCADFTKAETITSIAILHVNDQEITSYSLEKTAKELCIKETDINQYLLKIEKKMLKYYFKFVKEHKEYTWIHWSTSSDNYGFKALENRAQVLHTRPYSIDDSRKICLSNLFVDLYDKGFASNPRIEGLMKLNNITAPGDFYPGKSKDPSIETEISLLDKHEYKKIRLSGIRKVKIFYDFLNLATDKKLKVLTPKKKMYGSTLKGYYALFEEQWWSQIVTFILGILFTKLLD